MDFEWDEEKNKKNIHKHKISFEEAALIFRGLTLTTIDTRKDYGEIREISIGQLSEQFIVTTVHTDRKVWFVLSPHAQLIKQKGKNTMTIVKKSLNDLSISKKRLAELEAIQDKDIDYCDIPELDEQFWKNAKVRLPETKTGVYIRLDSDILEWMKSQGKGYQGRINAILRSYYEAHKNEQAKHL